MGQGISKLDLVFGGLLIGFSVYFVYWGFDFIGNGSKAVFLLSAIFGMFMAFNIGGNDVANSFGTSVGAKTLSLKQALCVAAIFEVSGAVLAGSEVTETIKSGIVNLDAFLITPMDFVYIMMSALVSAGIWLFIATKKGMPVSTTHAIIGGIVGSSLSLGYIMDNPDISTISLVKWSEIGSIALSWITSPLLGGVVSYIVYSLIKKYILNYNDIAQAKLERLKSRKKELKKAFKLKFETLNEDEKIKVNQTMISDFDIMSEISYDANDLESEYYKELHKISQEQKDLKTHNALEYGVPIIAAIGAFMISAMMLFKGLNNLHLGLSMLENFLTICMISAVVWMSIFILAKTLRSKDLSKSTFLLFSWLQVFTAAGFAFSHGSNDIANAVGPFAAIIDTLSSGNINSMVGVGMPIMVTFGIALIAGLWFIGREVIATVGTNLTKIHPASGFSAEISAASVVMMASVLGIPVSSTHILIGAVLGIGLVNKQANWKLVRPIFLAWIITIPASCIMSGGFFVLFKSIF
ncbi:phosphate-transport permease PitB [Campylobacter sputorum subsp. bubulus]|uniref:Phosphate transporter n=1 Tax=Campylobacter sputorum subsp. sputorum TaxID=32024 RepID=A0A381DKR0_9BACT|nr:inorganic phosphate transporter [Campylobacter sputorum]ASM34615.1 inorganic phosphate transporter, PitA family [Campylobacter sputorum aubsp. sputorum RM3237]KAB0581170.1 phosphate permease [Campylobacter sputorum subsp. sputorum]QEL04806.1 inorganic phosphate transporter, PitA family [Campylobacter sputorum subsp. sputorum]SUX09785.1 phosphate-transport permease PitB [Campylobacter sputorum subsp. bubulus]SUX11292.1 phosphate-transport permease PitB [Campylobacter sputorum subsp. sputorum